MQRRLTLLLLAAACIAQGQARSNPSDGMDPRIARGRYIAMIGGCNDGHTARFAESGGNVPESDWFTGSALGYSGPWGTTFASNLHIAIGSMTLENWRSYARQAKLRPPMPFWALKPDDAG